MNFKDYHFHIYFEQHQSQILESILEKLKELKDIKIGRVWNKPIGPHPIGSCQITVPLGRFEWMVQWFLYNREGLDIFVHAVSGDDIKDHTDYIVWIGNQHTLNLGFFNL